MFIYRKRVLMTGKKFVSGCIFRYLSKKGSQ